MEGGPNGVGELFHGADGNAYSARNPETENV